MYSGDCGLAAASVCSIMVYWTRDPPVAPCRTTFVMIMRYALTALLLFCASASSVMAADITLASGLNVAPGGAVPLSVFLTNAAPPGGVTVTLSSSDTSKVTVSPQYVYIPAGLTAPSGLPRLTGVGFGIATVSASAFGLIGTSEDVQVSASLSGPATQTSQPGTKVR